MNTETTESPKIRRSQTPMHMSHLPASSFPSSFNHDHNNIIPQPMFQKQNLPEDFSTINFQNYTEKSEQRPACLSCNPILTFILLAFVFILFGIVQLVSTYQATVVTIPLDRWASTFRSPQTTQMSFLDGESVAVYLEIQKLTQFDHLNEVVLHENGLETGSCEEYSSNKQLKKTLAFDGTTLVPGDQAKPCGYYSGMFPIGTIAVTFTNGTILPFESAGLTNFDYSLTNQSPSLSWVDLTSPFFQSWMQPNVKIKTTKLLGRLTTSFEGLVDITITMPNNVPSELPSVSIILESDQVFGHQNISFAFISFLQSSLLFVFAFALYFYGKLIREEAEQSQKPAGHKIEIRSEHEEGQVKSQ